MPTDFFGRVMVVFQRYGMSMLQGAGVSHPNCTGCAPLWAVSSVLQWVSCRQFRLTAKDNPIKKGSFVGDQAHY